MDDFIVITVTTILITILTSLILVPIVYVLNSKLEFDNYLNLLWEEIEENQKRVNSYESDFEEVRSGTRDWMPKGQPYQISSDCALVENSDLTREMAFMESHYSETDGIKYRYLPDNIYSNFIHQKYFLFIQEGYRNCLARLYYHYKSVSYLIQHKENKLLTDFGNDNRRTHYTKEEFLSIYERYLPRINKEYDEIKKSKSSFKKPHWWFPIGNARKASDTDDKKTLDRMISINIFILTLGMFVFGTIQIYFSYLQILAIERQEVDVMPLASQILSASFLFAFTIVIFLFIPIVKESLK